MHVSRARATHSPRHAAASQGALLMSTPQPPRRPRAATPSTPAKTPGAAPLTARRMHRLGAFAIDALLMLSLMIVIGIAFPPALAILGFLAFAYFTARDLFRGPGRSLGRAMSKQRLMTVDGQEATVPRILARNAVRNLLWLTVIPFFIDLAMVLFGEGRLIADHIFDTQVLEDPEALARANENELARARAIVAASGDSQAAAPSDTFFDSDESAFAPESEERLALEKIDFDNPEFTRRQLDDFDARLAEPNDDDLDGLSFALPPEPAAAEHEEAAPVSVGAEVNR